MANLKLKGLLQKLFENKKFEIRLKDTETYYDGYNYVTDDVVYEIKFHVVVRTVVGEGVDAVGDMDIIIDSITKNGKDHYNNWVNRHYDDGAWYIDELDDEFYLEYLEDLPFSIYTNFYGYDQERNEEDTIDESVIKKVIKETLIDKFFDSMFSDLGLDNLESMVIRDNRSLHKSSVGYYNPDLKKMFFRVVEPFKSSYWDSDDPQSRIRPIQHPKTLYIREDIYKTIMDFIPNKKMVVDWFNEKYDQNVEQVLNGGTHLFL
jgi:hypothetical protein